MLRAEMVGQVGPSVLSDGTGQALRQARTGELIISELHGRYYEQTYRQGMFSVSDTGGRTTTAGVATTWTGLALANPVTSGVNLVIGKVFIGQVAALAAGSIGVMWSRNAALISGGPSPINRFVSSQAISKAVTGVTATLTVTPILLNTFAFGGTLATTGYGLVSGVFIDFEGSIIVPPDGILLSYTSAATTTALQFGYQWEEVAI